MTCGQAIRDFRQAAISEGHPLGTSWDADEAEKTLAAAIDAAQQEAYENGRADEREDLRTLLQQTQCVRDGWHPFTALALQAELLAALDDEGTTP
jgi:hypothetical protein